MWVERACQRTSTDETLLAARRTRTRAIGPTNWVNAACARSSSCSGNVIRPLLRPLLSLSDRTACRRRHGWTGPRQRRHLANEPLSVGLVGHRQREFRAKVGGGAAARRDRLHQDARDRADIGPELVLHRRQQRGIERRPRLASDGVLARRRPRRTTGCGAAALGHDARAVGAGVPQHLAQRLGHVGTGIEAVRRMLSHGALEHQLQAGRRAAHVGRQERQGVVLDAVADLGHVAALESPFAGDHLVQHGAGRKDIGSAVDDVVAAALLGRHVGRRADRREHGRGLDVHQLRDAEIAHLHPMVGGHHDVAGLDVLVDHALLVRAGQRIEDLQHDGDGLRNVHGRLVVEQLAQAAPGHELHRQVGLLLVKGEVVDRDDVGMRAARGRLGLAPEAPDVVGAVGAAHQLGRDQLDGDGPAQDGIVRLVDLAHAANADQFLDDVAADVGRERLHGYRSRRTPLMCPPASSWRSEGCGASG